MLQVFGNSDVHIFDFQKTNERLDLARLPRSGAGVGVGMLRGAGADTRRGPYVLY